MTIAEGRARCDQDSEDVAAGDASVFGFLHFPMPRNDAENQLFYDILGGGFLDITEILPSTSPRSWVYRDGSPVTWFKWFTGEPNHPNKERHVEMFNGRLNKRYWNDIDGNYPGHQRNVNCIYFLPAGAEKICPWLQDLHRIQGEGSIRARMLFGKG